MLKSAQETEKICMNIGGGVITCIDVPKNTPKPEIERIKRDLTRGEKRFRQKQKIAQITNHGKILSAQSSAQSLVSFFDSKKKLN